MPLYRKEIWTVLIPIDDNDPDGIEIKLPELLADDYEFAFHKFWEHRNNMDAHAKLQGVNIE